MTSSPRLRSASNTALPKACWPCTTIRIQRPPCRHPGPAKQEPESIAAPVRNVLDRGLGVPACAGTTGLLDLGRLGARAFLRRRDRARRLDIGNLGCAVAELLGENFFSMLA